MKTRHSMKLLIFAIAVVFATYNKFCHCLPTQIIRYNGIEPDPSEVFITSDQDKLRVNISGARTSMAIYEIGTHWTTLPTFTFNCSVQELQPEYTISSFQLCFKDSLVTFENCIQISLTRFETANKAAFKANILNGKTGAVIISDWKDIFTMKDHNRPNLSGYYFCRLTNKMGILDSAMVLLQDNMKKSIDVLNHYQYDIRQSMKVISTTIEPKDLPYSFSCGDKSLSQIGAISAEIANNPRLKAPFVWKMCSAMTGNSPTDAIFNEQDCVNDGSDTSKLAKISNSDFGEIIVLLNGTFVYMDIGPKIPDGIMIGCRSALENDANYHRFYSGDGKVPADDPQRYKLIKINKAGTQYNGPFMALTETSRTYDVLAGNFSVPVKISAIYKANPTATRRWLKDGQEIPSTYNFSKTNDKFHLTFPFRITPEHSGKYALEIEGKAQFTYDITVSPVVTILNQKTIPKEIFCLNGDSISLTYVVSTDKSTKNFYVNGQKLGLETSQSLKDSIANLQDPRPSIKRLNVTIDPLIDNGLNSKTEITYKVDNLEFKNYDEAGQSHVVTFTVENAKSLARVSTVVKVLPYPEPSSYPSAFNCEGSSCVSTKEQFFECKFPTNKYNNEGVYMRKFWYLHTYLLGVDLIIDSNNRTFDPMEFFELRDNNDTLVLHKIENGTDNAQSLKSILKATTVKCRLVLFKPGMEEQYDLSFDELLNENNTLFDSFNNYTYENQMLAFIKYYEGQVVQASLGWIAAVIVGFLLIILVVILVILYLKRDKKETYRVADEEVEHGNDPEREIKEKEEFHTYERGDESEDHLLNGPQGGRPEGRRVSLDNSSVGVNDDYELDEYALDDKTYNEDGSFVNEYRPNPRARDQADVRKSEGGGGGPEGDSDI